MGMSRTIIGRVSRLRTVISGWWLRSGAAGGNDVMKFLRHPQIVFCWVTMVYGLSIYLSIYGMVRTEMSHLDEIIRSEIDNSTELIRLQL